MGVEANQKTWKLAWILVAAALGCSKKDSGAEPAKIAEPANGAEAARPSEPFTGPLTIERIMGSKGVAKSLEPWPEGFARLQAQLGAPTKTDGKKYLWAVMEGNDCAYTYLEKADGTPFHHIGDVVFTAASPGKYGRHDAEDLRDECLAVLGKDDGPPEAPDALPPPADGKVTVAMLLRNAFLARSKWQGQEITLTGVLGRTSPTTNDLYFQDEKDKAKWIHCDPDSASAKSTFRIGQPIVATAKVGIILSHRDEHGLKWPSVELTSCTAVKQP
jgi:hypothetical protein